MASTNVRIAHDSDNHPSDNSAHHEARPLSHLWSDLLRAQSAVDQCEGGLDNPEFDGLVADVAALIDEIMSREPENLYDCAAQLRAIIAGFETDAIVKAQAVPTLERIERLLCKRGASPAGYEDAAARLCAGYWLLREYFDVLAPTSLTVTEAEWNNHRMRLGWLVDRLAEDVDAVGIAMWGSSHDRLVTSDGDAS